MAISLQTTGGRHNANDMNFFCDFTSEIALLPTTTTRGINGYEKYDSAPMGSSCYCFQDGNVYCLSSSGWKIV